MSDMSQVIVPKSDQWNADDFLGTSRTFTVAGVNIRGGQEQPVSIVLEGSDKVFRPCKSMCRVMAQAWGLDSSLYSGRSMTLYCDPSVKFGPLAVGGIRISHMSHIDGPMTMALTATKGVKKSYKVLPLVMPTGGERQAPAGLTVDDARAALDNATTPDALRAAWASRAMAPFREELQAHLEARKAELTTAGEGPADEQRGEAHTTSDAEADILMHLARKVTVIDVNSLLSVRINELDEEGQSRVRSAAVARMAEIKGTAE